MWMFVPSLSQRSKIAYMSFLFIFSESEATLSKMETISSTDREMPRDWKISLRQTPSIASSPSSFRIVSTRSSLFSSILWLMPLTKSSREMGEPCFLLISTRLCWRKGLWFPICDFSKHSPSCLRVSTLVLSINVFLGAHWNSTSAPVESQLVEMSSVHLLI